ncbi:MAG: hypothetical protein LBB88_06190 [Planctomycetaceae bacterium]|jgi:hypothetical protein|nr:hypothetical protein [Planctomycetaceae bacterium]
MKTISIPQRKKSVARSYKTIAPPAPHVNLAIKHKLNPTAKKTKHLRKRNIVTKINDGDNICINNANTKTNVNLSLATITTNSPVKSRNPKVDKKKSTIDKHVYVNWPKQIKRKNLYSEIISSDNDSPFDLDELTTLENFESIIKANDIESLSRYSGTKQIKPTRQQNIQRRRHIDPTTCERNYSMEEVEFMNAISEYKRSSGRMFPTCSEILEVLKNLGYEKLK